MEKYKIERSETGNLPMYLNQQYIKPPGISCKRIIKKDIPINNIQDYPCNGEIKFEINSENFLDPYSLFLELTVHNLGITPIQIDNSAHSLIKKIEVRYKKNNKIMELIDDYDILMSLYFDMNLPIKERRERHENEGFGYNEWGSNETIIPANNYSEQKWNNYCIEKFGVNDSTEIKNILARGLDDRVTTNFNQQEIDEFKTVDVEDKIYERKIPKIENWEEVQGGKIQPFKCKFKNYTDDISKKKFKIPLMLKLIGHGIQNDNFKYVPLKILGPFYIIITLNSNAFFIPALGKRKDFIGTNFKEFVKSTYAMNSKISYQLESVNLQYELVEFTKDIEDSILREVSNNSWVVDYIGFAYINHFYLFNSPTLDGVTEFKEQTEIKALHIIFLTNLHEHSPYSRPLARHNKGIKRIEFTWNHIDFPETIMDNNSLNTFGDHNADYFWEQVRKNIELKDTFGPDKDRRFVLSKTNFCLGKSLSEVIGLYDYAVSNGLNTMRTSSDINIAPFNVDGKIALLEPEWNKYYINYNKSRIINNSLSNMTGQYGLNIEIPDTMEGYMPDFQAKTIYTFNFDSQPYSYKQYRNGLKIKENDKFRIRVTRVDNHINFDPFATYNAIYTFMYIYAEYYETLVLGSDGEFRTTV